MPPQRNATPPERGRNIAHPRTDDPLGARLRQPRWPHDPAAPATRGARAPLVGRAVLAACILAAALLAWGLFLPIAAAAAASPTPLRPAANNAAAIRDVAIVLLVICAVIFLTVEVLLLTAIIRFRGRREEQASRTESNRNLEIAWTVIPFLIVIGLFVVTITTMHRLEPPGKQTTVTVTGKRWWWDVRYGPGVVTANEGHLPVDTPVRIALKSTDVIHSFWVPQLAGKTDMTPGRTTFTGFTAHTPGWYLGECSEFCGAEHAHMRFWVKIETPEEYQGWLRLQASPAGDPAPGDATSGDGTVWPRARCP